MKLKLNELKPVYTNLDKETYRNNQIKEVFKNLGFEDVTRGHLDV
jgi:hypothetical protein